MPQRPLNEERIRSSGYVLVVEDRAPVRDMIVREIQSGFRAADVVAVGTAYDAYGVLRTRGAARIVIADLRLDERNRGPDGITFLDECGRNYPRMSRILYSGYLDIELLWKAAVRGHIVAEKGSPSNLRNALRTALGKWPYDDAP